MSASTDQSVVTQFERVIRRVKHSMRYRGSYTTRDILGALVARWLQSGEWERLKVLPESERHIGESVRRFILDRLDQLRRRGEQIDLRDELLAAQDEATLTALAEEAELRAWIRDRVAELEVGVVDPRFAMPLASPRDTGRALRLQLAVSLGVAHKRLAEGTNYLIVLQGIEAGLCDETLHLGVVP